MSTRRLVYWRIARARGAAIALVLAAVGAGCARRVVIDPDEVHRHNTDWVLRRPSPGPSGVPAPGALPAPPSSSASSAPAAAPPAPDAGAPPRMM
jgi:hypothetical protein